jgi:Arc/MetJ family transcription regulator
MRTAKTLTIDESLLAEVEQTKGTHSTSARVNELLKRGLEQERREALEREAACFYSVANKGDRREEREFEKASVVSLARD